MAYKSEDDLLVESAMRSIRLGNNGYADLPPGFPHALIPCLEQMGIIVIMTRGLHGLPVLRGFTEAAQKALKLSPFGVSNYKKVHISPPTGDSEAAILAGQEQRILIDY